MIEQGAAALNNRKTETEAGLVGFRGIGKPVEFAENLAPLVYRYARPAIRHVDAQHYAAAPATDDDAAARSIAHGVGDQVEHDPFEQDWIAAHPRASRRQPQRQSFLFCHSREGTSDPSEQPSDRKLGDCRRDYPGIELRDI